MGNGFLFCNTNPNHLRFYVTAWARLQGTKCKHLIKFDLTLMPQSYSFLTIFSSKFNQSIPQSD